MQLYTKILIGLVAGAQPFTERDTIRVCILLFAEYSQQLGVPGDGLRLSSFNERKEFFRKVLPAILFTEICKP